MTATKTATKGSKPTKQTVKSRRPPLSKAMGMREIRIVGLPADFSPLLLSVEQAALKLAVGRTVMYRLVSSGTIDSLKVGCRRCIPVDAVERYIAQQRLLTSRISA